MFYSEWLVDRVALTEEDREMWWQIKVFRWLLVRQNAFSRFL